MRVGASKTERMAVLKASKCWDRYNGNWYNFLVQRGEEGEKVIRACQRLVPPGHIGGGL